MYTLSSTQFEIKLKRMFVYIIGYDLMLQAAGIKVQTLVEYLQGYMNEHGLDQNEFGRKAHISSATMSHIMSGKTKRPGPEILAKIADATGKSYLLITAMLDHRLNSELELLMRDLAQRYPDIDSETIELAARLKRLNQRVPGIAEDLLRLVETKK